MMELGFLPVTIDMLQGLWFNHSVSKANINLLEHRHAIDILSSLLHSIGEKQVTDSTPTQSMGIPKEGMTTRRQG
jgi:hypothetical protein